MPLAAQTLTTLYDFGQFGRGVTPDGLILSADRNYYGTTAYGGTNSCREGCRTVFKMTPAGSITILHQFCAGGSYPGGCPDGFYPKARLLEATGGDLYGTASQGGANGISGGTIFKITAGGALTTLYSFCSQGAYPKCREGEGPLDLVQDANGDLRGGGSGGGDRQTCPNFHFGCGTIFSLPPGPAPVGGGPRANSDGADGYR